MAVEANSAPRMSEPAVRAKARLSLLWISMISMAMAFAGLTSGYVVSRSALLAENLWRTFGIPSVFAISTVVLVLSSALLFPIGKLRRNGQLGKVGPWLLGALLLGVVFGVLQWQGFAALMQEGVYFTGQGSSTSGSWFYVIVAFHFAHFAAGWIALAVATWKGFTGGYGPGKDLGLRLAITFWHFLGLLWLYLYVFLAIIR
jgi:cytochrome c oxidase subunit 3